MAKIPSGILGGIIGKVSGVVGAKWKQTNYIRSYAIPANPNTSSQQAQRNKMKTVIWILRGILGSVIQPYVDPFQKKMSGFNRLTQIDLKAMSDFEDFASIKVCEGSLEKIASISGAVYSSAVGKIAVAWSPSALGNGLSTDSVTIVAIDTANRITWVDDASQTRADTPQDIDVGSGRSAADLHVYLFCHRGADASLEVSDSLYSAVS